MPFIKPVTGVNVTTSVSMESADLGAMRWDEQRGAIAAMFGDNFSFWRMQGEWQSPSIILYDNDFNVLGVPTKDGIAANQNRKQLWPYPHANDEYTTILPCDFIKVGDWWYVAAMVTRGLGNELRTVFWRSRDLYDWEKTTPYVSLVHPGHPGNVMLTFDQIADYVYIFGTGGLARNMPIWMWRCPADQFPQWGSWEPWGMDSGNGKGWGWGNPNEHYPVLSGRYGELCFRAVQDNCVLSFFDVDNYSCSALTVPDPTDYWPGANRVDYATGDQFQQLYGGYIAPASRLNDPNGMKFFVSQWVTATNDPYHVVAIEDTLAAMGPLAEPEPRPTPTPVPTPTPTPTPPTPTPPTPKPPQPEPEEPPVSEPTTPQELYELLLRELSASGSKLITTPEGENITLREAISQIFIKERYPADLKGKRPWNPSKPDDQLGQTLSTRAEGLFTQALVVALSDHLLGADTTTAIYKQVKDSLQ